MRTEEKIREAINKLTKRIDEVKKIVDGDKQLLPLAIIECQKATLEWVLGDNPQPAYVFCTSCGILHIGNECPKCHNDKQHKWADKVYDAEDIRELEDKD